MDGINYQLRTEKSITANYLTTNGAVAGMIKEQDKIWKVQSKRHFRFEKYYSLL